MCMFCRSGALTTFKLEGEVTSLSESSQGEVGDNREKWGDFWENLIPIAQYRIASPFQSVAPLLFVYKKQIQIVLY